MLNPWSRPVGIWLLTGCLLIAAMITVGGVTRLTGSGLSITEWNVLMGALPPLSEADWEALFTRYQASPQYQLMNAHFTLAEFKGIFWWEYIHRLIGRLLGLVFLIPFLWFLIRGAFDRPLLRRVLLIFALGAFQGVLGWLMVASGLVDRPSVSHYRLAAHLLTAFLTFAVTLWVALEVLRGDDVGVAVPTVLRRMVVGLVVLFVVQAGYGALVAGLKAGFMFNTFPHMGPSLTPPGLLLMEPAIRNLTENPVTVQFVHRTLAWLMLPYAVWLWHSLKVHGVRRRANLLFGAVLLQFTLGALTILRLPTNPVLWGALHQAGAVLLLAALVWLLFGIRRQRPSPAGA
jgi:heme a synthase